MKKNYTHEIASSSWVVISYFFSMFNIPAALAIIGIAHFLITLWFLLAWRRKDEINTVVKIVTTAGMILYFLQCYACTGSIFKLVKLPIESPKYLKVGNAISNQFLIVLIAAFIVSLLVILIFRKHYLYATLLFATPSFCIKPFWNFSTAIKASLSIGIHSASILAIITATYLSSALLHRFFNFDNNSMDPGDANTAAQVTQ